MLVGMKSETRRTNHGFKRLFRVLAVVALALLGLVAFALSREFEESEPHEQGARRLMIEEAEVEEDLPCKPRVMRRSEMATRLTTLSKQSYEHIKPIPASQNVETVMWSRRRLENSHLGFPLAGPDEMGRVPGFGSEMAFEPTTDLSDEDQLPVWMLWDTGFDSAPGYSKSMMQSCVDQHPGRVRVLTLEQAEALFDRPSVVEDCAWNLMTIQAKSDVIRVNVLAMFGGIWLDASVYCLAPIDDWLAEKTFGTLLRTDQWTTEAERPWPTSWLIVARQGSIVMRKWRDSVNKIWDDWLADPTQPIPHEADYFWMHRAFTRLARTDPEFQRELETDSTILDAKGPFCLWENRDRLMPIYKRPKMKTEADRMHCPMLFKWADETGVQLSRSPDKY